MSREYYGEEKFWSSNFYTKVSRPDKNGCCNWIGSITNRGYGKFRVGKISVGAHRVAWTLKNGPIPDELLVLHKCDNPLCVNPDHLFVGTQGDNLVDMIHKGRGGNRGQQITKFYGEEIWLMKRLAYCGITGAVIGKIFKTSKATINRIVYGNDPYINRRIKYAE